MDGIRAVVVLDFLDVVDDGRIIDLRRRFVDSQRFGRVERDAPSQLRGQNSGELQIRLSQAKSVLDGRIARSIVGLEEAVNLDRRKRARGGGVLRIRARSEDERREGKERPRDADTATNCQNADGREGADQSVNDADGLRKQTIECCSGFVAEDDAATGQIIR